ncbi:MAG: LD-carboxypeptidase [Rhodospirillales bacterium]
MPGPLRPGDLVRFLSPASSPERAAVEASAAQLRRWGLRVDFGANAFRKLNYLAGTDEERLSDVNAALRDPEVRAIFATRGGKGSYRIADRLDFAAARHDPKHLVGFSDITILQLALWREGIGGAIQGAFSAADRDSGARGRPSVLKRALMERHDIFLAATADEETFTLTTDGSAQGPLVGGNLDTIATAAGWALPRLTDCILLLEAANMYLGQVDRQLTMLRKGGHLDGLAGIALGRFSDVEPSGALTVHDLLREHLAGLAVPILGGLPAGHGEGAMPLPMGYRASLDCERRLLIVARSGGD